MLTGAAVRCGGAWRLLGFAAVASGTREDTVAAKSSKQKKGSKGGADNPLSQDRRLRTLLKPLLPAGTTLSPLTFEQAYHPGDLKGFELPEGLEASRVEVTVGFKGKKQEVIAVKLHALTAVVPEAKAFALV